MNAIEMSKRPDLTPWERAMPMKTIAILEARSGIGVLFNDIQMPASQQPRRAKQAILLLTTISVSDIAFGI